MKPEAVKIFRYKILARRVELTGSLASFTFAMQNTRLIALAKRFLGVDL